MHNTLQFVVRALVILAAMYLTGCGARYIEPTGVPAEQLAFVQTADISKFDGLRVDGKKGFLVRPGAHIVTISVGQAISVGQVIGEATPWSCDIRLEFLAANRYEILVKAYIDGNQIILRNVTANRTTYFDPQRYIYYDENNQLLPRPQGPYAP